MTGHDPVASAPPVQDFPVVGIGASAGGLAAFEAFFAGMPPDTDSGMAFVLVQHLAPDHKSLLSDLLKRYTQMRVFEVEDGMAVAPDCAYIIPPNRDMALEQGVLRLLAPSAPRGQRLPIDFFFRSLAQDRKERALCIILSGTGSDGVLGLRAVKGEGGLVMAQDPESAEYDGMPRAAIATGLVDFVLPPAAMLGQLLRFSRRAFTRAPAPGLAPASATREGLQDIFALLQAQTGHDFAQYKSNTIIRRVERRMAVHQIADLTAYVGYCRQAPAELAALFQDLLIGVTQFFRDGPEFQALQEIALPRLFAGRPAGASLRVWIPGCSTGEEAYSLAILLQEQREALNKPIKIQVFATDIDRRAVEIARRGLYPPSIAADLTPGRLARYFTRQPEDTGYRVHKRIRDLLIFSEQDVIRDPPFSKIDLISCRNLLIYFGRELHKKLIPLFHYALNPGGVLFLGTSESAGEFTDLFAALDRKSKLYLRKEEGPSRQRPVHSQPARLLLPPPRADGQSASPPKLALRDVTERALLAHYGAVAILVTERGDILYLHGRTGRFLEPAPGEAGLNILRMAREGLRPALTSALHQALGQAEAVTRPGLQVKTNGDLHAVTLTVKRLAAGSDPGAGPPLVLVILEDAPPSRPARSQTGRRFRQPQPSADPAVIVALQQELRAKEEYLQSNIEALETSNEELKSAYEEMQAVNEELQSANEELETSKEELQSVNEELATVNSELQSKVIDLAKSNNDMNNLLASTNVGTVFVDHQLLIRRFTSAVTEVINLIPTDLGRPLGHILSNLLDYNSLVEDVKAVLDTLIPKEVEVQTRIGAWYLLRIRPYRTLDNVIEGAVITCVDITEVKQAQRLARESRALHHLAVVVRDSGDAILMLDPAGHILAWNPAAERLYGWSAEEALTKTIEALDPATPCGEALSALRRASEADGLAALPALRVAKNGARVPIWLTANALRNEAGEVYAIATTERRRTQDAGHVPPR